MTTYAIPVDPALDHLVESSGRPHHRRPPTARGSQAAPGPTADLVSLPDPDELEATAGSPHAYLLQAEAARLRQLDALPATDRDPVMAAYRSTVTRILGDVRAALLRADAGRYGICSACDATIERERLEHRPWATTCARCAERHNA